MSHRRHGQPNRPNRSTWHRARAPRAAAFRGAVGVGALLIALCMTSAPLAAGTISIGISHRLEIGPDEIAALVAVSNSGDEAAHSVAVMVDLFDTELRGDRRAILEPGESFEERLVMAAREGEGRFPYRVAVDYTDANQYPFQALSVATFEIGSPPPSPIVMTSIDSPELGQQGTLSVRVKNITESGQTASLRVVVPKGIEAVGGAKSLTFEPWQELDVDVALTNRFALAGSRYPTFVIVESADGGFHQSVVATAELEVVDDVPLPQSSRSHIWIAALVLGVLFAALAMWRLASR